MGIDAAAAQCLQDRSTALERDLALGGAPAEEHRAKVHAAVESCPVLALTLSG